MRLVRLYYAVRDIPFQRNLYRIYIRGLVFLVSKFPVLFFLFRKEVVVQERCDGLEVGLLDQIKAYYSTLDSITFNGDSIKVFAENFDAHWMSEQIFSIEEGSNSLKKMSVTYFGYIHGAYPHHRESLNLFLKNVLLTIRMSPEVIRAGALKHVWHPYTASHRVINLCAYLSYADLDRDLETLIIDNIKDSLSVIHLFKEYELHYNHYSKNLLALAIAQQYFGISCWVKAQQLIDALTYQVNPEGIHAELAPMYHFLFVKDLAMFERCADLGLHVLGEVKRLKALMLEAGKVFEVDGQLCLFGDSWRGEVDIPEQYVEQDEGGGNRELCLPLSGFYKYVTKDYGLLVDLGVFGAPDNPGHGHSDTMSIELYSGGYQVVCDYGVPTYSAGEDRDYSRSSWAHNGPCVAEQDFNDMWSSFRVGRRSQPASIVRLDNGLLMKYRPYIFKSDSHISREITFFDKRVEIRDEWVLRGDDTAFTPFLLFLLNANVSVASEMGESCLGMGIVRGAHEISEGVYFPAFGRSESCKKVSIVPAKLEAGEDGVVRHASKVTFSFPAHRK